MKSPVSIIIVINLLVCFVLVLIYPHLMISPGQLLEGHQKLTGDCFACHTPFLRSNPKNCLECHKLEQIGKFTTAGEIIINDKATVAFHQKLIEHDCVACHSDHQGVKVYRKIHRFSHELVIETVRSECKACHDKPEDKVHRKLKFNCNQCHSQDKWKPASFDHARYFSSVKSDNCIECHAKPDDRRHRKIKAKLVEDCGVCHQTEKWKPASFKHELYFKISGNKICTDCHEKPADKLHRKMHGQCEVCHSTEKWKPASFDHDRYFRFDRHHETECETCHVNNDYNQYTCYGCHEHNQWNIREEHLEEGIREFDNCTECHRSGDEDEAERIWKSKRGLFGREHDDDDIIYNIKYLII